MKLGKFYLIGVILILSYSQVLSQKNNSIETLVPSFLKDTVEINPGQFAFNSLNLSNNSSQNSILSVSFILPNGWSFVTIPTPSIELRKGEFQNIPFRISPSREAIGDLNYPIIIKLKNQLTGKETVSRFFVKIKQNTQWNAFLINENLIIDKLDSVSKFELRIKNIGNKRELFEIEFKSDLRMSLPSTGTQMLLGPKKDSTLVVYVSNKMKSSKSNSVSFYVKSKNQTIMLIGHVFFVSETLIGHEKKFGYIPIDVEYFGLNIFNSNYAFNFFNIGANFQINKDRNITLRYRTGTFNTEKTINNESLFLNYRGKNLNINLGNQISFVNYQINGNGLRVGYRSNKGDDFEIYGIKSRYGNSRIIGIKTESANIRKYIFKSDILYISDQIKKESVFFGLHNLEIKKSKDKLLYLSGGYGFDNKSEKASPIYSYMGGYRFEQSFKKVQIHSSYYYYSPYFPGILKGVKYGDHELKIGAKKVSLFLFSQSSARQPFLISEELEVLNRKTISNEHGARIGLNSIIGLASIGYSFVDQFEAKSDFGKMKGKKISLSFANYGTKIRQSLLCNYTQSNLNNISNKNLKESIGFYYQFKYKELGINANYNNGAVYYFDFLNFASTTFRPKSYNMSLFYTFDNKEHTFYDRVYLSTIKNSNQNTSSLFFTNEIYKDFPKARLSFNVYSNLNIMNIKSFSTLNISVKKLINVPVFFKPKYFSASVFMFKDKNSNDIYDSNDEPVANASLVVNGQTVVSNKKGMVFLKNMEKDEYIIDYKKIQNLKGWIIKGRSSDTLLLNRNISIGVPFKQSRLINGRIKYEQEGDRVTQNFEGLGGILVVAINKKGEVFKSSTNANGEFYFNLNEDIYNIQMPTNIFNDGYRIQKSIISVDLTKVKESEIEFIVTKKSRAINIKKS